MLKAASLGEDRLPLLELAHQKGFDALAAALDCEHLAAVDEALAEQFQVERLRAEPRMKAIESIGFTKRMQGFNML